MVGSVQYKPIGGDDFVVFYGFFSFFISYDKEEPKRLILQRIQRVQFHVAHDDYFGTLATNLSLLLESKTKKNQSLLKKWADDLVYLQKSYKIVKK